MGPNRTTSNPFLSSPASFERLDNKPDAKPPVSSMETTVTTQEINSSWENFLTPTPIESKPIHLESNVEIGGLTEISFVKPQVEEQLRATESIPEPMKDVIRPKISPPIESTIGTTINVTKKVTRISFGTGKDVKTAIFDLFKTYVLFKVESPEEKKKKEAQKDNKKKSAPATFSTSSMSNDALSKRASQADDINRRLKNTNLSFEGVLNTDGSVRADIQAILDKVNSELAEADIKRKKDAAMQAAAGNSKKGGGARGPRVSTNLNLSAEDANNVTKLLG